MFSRNAIGTETVFFAVNRKDALEAFAENVSAKVNLMWTGINKRNTLTI